MPIKKSRKKKPWAKVAESSREKYHQILIYDALSWLTKQLNHNSKTVDFSEIAIAKHETTTFDEPQKVSYRYEIVIK